MEKKKELIMGEEELVGDRIGAELEEEQVLVNE